MATIQSNEKAPLLKDKTPMLNYTKRYDQVSWRSADTDFEVDPSASGADEQSNTKTVKSNGFCTRRSRKLIALIVVVIIFLVIMGGLIYLYYSKTAPETITKTPIVSTDCGDLTGAIETTTMSGKEVQAYMYKGIPFAQPPLKNLRWSAPMPLSKNRSTCWRGVYEAISYRSKCAQNGTNGMEGSEDCLYLNVYSPSLDSNLPVFVWLHGGHFMTGHGHQSGMSPDIEFITSMNVVAVTLNFRLSAFGFLTLKELWKKDKWYGNYGLMDQILALKWIQRNIKNFGGDPNSVTICGQSSGGTSIFGLLASPLADGLFHKAIPMSGSPKFEKPYEDAAEENRVFLNKTNCSSIDTEMALQTCLYKLTTADVINAVPYEIYPEWSMNKYYDFPTKNLFYGALAVVDPVVVPTPPKNLKNIFFKNEKQKVSVLIGSMAQEIGISPFVNFIEKSSDDYYIYLKSKLNPFSTTFVDKVLGNYNFTRNDTKMFPVELVHETIASDVLENCPLNDFTDDIMKSSHHNVYRYVVAHKPNKPIPFGEFNAQNAFSSWDAIALFNFKMVEHDGYIPSSSDLKFQQSIRSNFKHFMSFGHLACTDWGKGKTAVFQNGGEIEVLSSHYHSKQCQFWNDASNGFTPYAWVN